MSFRLAAGVGALVCALLLGFGYYLQYVKELDPCPLCLVQRGFFYALLVVFAVAALRSPVGAGRIVYGTISALFALGGLAAAGRQVWLQHLPPEKVPQCGPDLYFMLENFPLARTLKTLVAGTGECAVVDWTFLGLSIAEWSLGWFVALFVYAIWLAARAGRAARSKFSFPEVNGKYR
jgi:disulfide bond formation protein DsbB